MNFPPPPEIKLNDMIDGTVKTMDEWIKNELYRIRNNIKPRHFDDYCQLVDMVNEDMIRYKAQCEPPPSMALPPRFVPFALYNEDEDVEEKYMGEDGCDTEDEDEDSNDDEQEDTDEDEETCINQQEQYITKSNNSIIPNHSNINHKQQTIQPTWLCRAFIEIMRYCSVTKNNQAPKLLLIEFDKLRQDIKLGKRVNVIEFRESLQKILFGKIQMTENLVKFWRLMCDWVTGPHLNSQEHALEWVNVSLNVYIAAQRLFITEVVMLRHKSYYK
jgi:hypothetical protein